MDGLKIIDGTYRIYFATPNDDLIKLWRSNVKVTVDHQVRKASVSTLGQQSPSACCHYRSLFKYAFNMIFFCWLCLYFY